jgi:hypothetical protein
MKTENTVSVGLNHWEKWLILSVINLGLSAVIIWFNVRVFGLAEGAPYIAVVSFLVLLSFVVTRHVKRTPVTKTFTQAAFLFEILLTVALGLNTALSLSVLRGMAVADQATHQLTENLTAVSKLRGSTTQREALQLVQSAGPVSSRQTVFMATERLLFWVMIAELVIGLLATFTLLGLSVFQTDQSDRSDMAESRFPAPLPMVTSYTTSGSTRPQ